jgi:uncharacterized protein
MRTTAKEKKQLRSQKSPLSFKIAQVWTGAEGTTVKLPLDVKVEFPGTGIDAVTPLTGELMLIKLKDEISVILKDVEIGVRFKCSRCLKEFEQVIEIPGAEREFLAERPTVADDLNDVCVIDMKDLTIDIYEMVRQEIILHFPFIQLCSYGCKGLCPKCGKDRNIRPCDCTEEETETFRPFKDLKKIITNSKKR